MSNYIALSVKNNLHWDTQVKFQNLSIVGGMWQSVIKYHVFINRLIHSANMRLMTDWKNRRDT